MNWKLVSKTIEDELEKYLGFLCQICSFEATAYDKEPLDLMANYIADFSKKEGFEVERIPFQDAGDFLCIDINKASEKSCVLLAHTDTVHKKGVFGEEPVQRLTDRIIAPGAIDCKGGIAIALLMMKALLKNGYSRHIRLLLTTDEEISNILGGEAERDFFVEKTTGFPYAINCETSENDEVVVARKGICRYRIDIKGVPGHAGIHYFECSNPIEEAAHKIAALHSQSKRGGVTYSCNIITGGVVENIIPETCSFFVDVRFPRQKDLEEVEATIKDIVNTCYVAGTSASYTCYRKRPPMEHNQDTDAVFDKLLFICKKYSLGNLTPVDSGGGSDSGYTQLAGITSICGMGACG